MAGLAYASLFNELTLNIDEIFTQQIYVDNIIGNTDKNTVYLQSNLLPGITDTYDLGSAKFEFNDIFSKTITTSGGGAVGGDFTVDGDFVVIGSSTLGTPLILKQVTGPNSTTVLAQAAAGNLNFNLPPSNGTSGIPLVTDGSGNTSWTNTLSSLVVSGSTLLSGIVSLGQETGPYTTVLLAQPGSGVITFALPPNQGTANYPLITDGSGNTSWSNILAALTLAGLTVNGATQINSTLGVTGLSTLGAVGCTTLTASGATQINSTLGVTGLSTLGAVGCTTLTVNNTLVMDQQTGANTTTVQAQTATGNINFNLPPNNGTNNYLLKTDGSGNTSWAAPPPASPAYSGAGVSAFYTGSPTTLTLSGVGQTVPSLSVSLTIPTAGNYNIFVAYTVNLLQSTLSVYTGGSGSQCANIYCYASTSPVIGYGAGTGGFFLPPAITYPAGTSYANTILSGSGLLCSGSGSYLSTPAVFTSAYVQTITVQILTSSAYSVGINYWAGDNGFFIPYGSGIQAYAIPV